LQINGAVGNVQLMQKINRLKVLNYIRQHSEAARPEIAKSTGLSPSSVTNIVTYLMDKKLVIEVGRVDSKEVGRKAALIRFNPSAASIISINIEISRITMALTDLDGNIISKNEVRLYKQETNDEVLKIIEKGVSYLLQGEKRSLLSSNIIGIGIAVSGLVLDDGRVEISTSLRWKGLSLKEYFEKIFHIPIYIQNNSKTKALAVLRKNGIHSDENIIFLDLAMGVGIINFYRNEINEAVIGEIGHTTVKKDGPRCFCGNRGCLEVMCSVETIISQCSELLKEGKCAELQKILNRNSMEEKSVSQTINNSKNDNTKIESDVNNTHISNTTNKNELLTYDMVLEAFEMGDKDVREVLRECGEYLGIGIANIINIFNPKKIIINGDVLLCSDYIYENALVEARSRAYERFMDGLEFNKVNIDMEKAIKGVSLYVTDRVFDLAGPEI